ncbi:hypothetical protein NMG60_11002707 [Bertholletia excelsa]
MANQVVQVSSLDCHGGHESKGKALVYASKVEQLHDRLRTLEQETEIMKQAFFKAMEERKKLMNEIYQQFQVIHHCISSVKQVRGHESMDGVLIDISHKNGVAGTGLSQVLHQQSNPLLVIRDLRATITVLKEPADS